MRLLFQFDSLMHTYLQIHTMFQMFPMLFFEAANDSWKGRRDVQLCISETVFQLGPPIDRVGKLHLRVAQLEQFFYASSPTGYMFLNLLFQLRRGLLRFRIAAPHRFHNQLDETRNLFDSYRAAPR